MRASLYCPLVLEVLRVILTNELFQRLIELLNK